MGIVNNFEHFTKQMKSRTFVQTDGMALTSEGFSANGNRIVNLGEGKSSSDAVTQHQVEVGLSTKVNKTMTDHLDANYHAIQNIQTAGDNDAFSLFHGKRIFLTTNGLEFDAKNQKIVNLVTDETNDSSAVSMAALKKRVTNSSSSSSGGKNIDLQNKYNVLNSKQRLLADLKTNYDSLVSFEEVNENFLSRQEEFPCKRNLT